MIQINDEGFLITRPVNRATGTMLLLAASTALQERHDAGRAGLFFFFPVIGACGTASFCGFFEGTASLGCMIGTR